MQQLPYASSEPGIKPEFLKHFLPSLVLMMQLQNWKRFDHLNLTTKHTVIYGVAWQGQEDYPRHRPLSQCNSTSHIPHLEGYKLADHRSATFWGKKINKPKKYFKSTRYECMRFSILQALNFITTTGHRTLSPSMAAGRAHKPWHWPHKFVLHMPLWSQVIEQHALASTALGSTQSAPADKMLPSTPAQDTSTSLCCLLPATVKDNTKICYSFFQISRFRDFFPLFFWGQLKIKVYQEYDQKKKKKVPDIIGFSP